MAAKKKKTVRRTTLRSSKGTKLYAVRNADGTFKDIQTYKRAHSADLRKTSKAEAKTTSKAKKTVKPKAAKGKTSRKTAARKKVSAK
jgi:hypothetical protein